MADSEPNLVRPWGVDDAAARLSGSLIYEHRRVGKNRHLIAEQFGHEPRRQGLPRRHRTQPVKPVEDRKSTRLNSSHVKNSYAVFCLKKKAISTLKNNG